MMHTWKDSVHSAKVDLEPLVVESDYQSEAGVWNKVAKSPLANKLSLSYLTFPKYWWKSMIDKSLIKLEIMDTR